MWILATAGLQVGLLEFSILLPEDVEVDGAPEAGALASDDNDGRRVDRKEDARATAAVPRVFHSFTGTG